jgi:hypothetical protein
MLWAKLDLPGMTRWADSIDPAKAKDNFVLDARGMLMSRVDAKTRARWLAQAKTPNPDDDLSRALIEQWAHWDPSAALAAAVATDDSQTLEEVAEELAEGPFEATFPKSSRFGLEAIRNFDVGALPAKFRDTLMDQWDEIMDQWGDVDVCEAARYGMDFLNRIDRQHRDTLMRYLGGEDRDDKESDIVRRTVAALRVWAVVRPRGMKAWIATLKDADMQKALTWLLNHAMGTGPKS